MKKIKNRAGFTLAELLIVVAIIAILVAIGIPAFSTAMERSRETVDLSNIRGAYAEFMAGSLGSSGNVGYYHVNIKQRDTAKNWIIDTNGFLTNVSNSTMPTSATESAFKTGDVWVVFSFDGSNAEKPKLSFATCGMNTTTKKPNQPTLTATQKTVASGDEWCLIQSGS